MRIPKVAYTRRFQSLVGTKDPKRVVDKLALYDENGDQICVNVIHTNKDGYEYIYCRNLYTEHGLFSDLPKDAYDHIKYGIGDVMINGLMFNTVVTKVLRFIDRDYGEKMRAKFLEGWKSAKFEWGINFNHKGSVNSGFVVMDGPVGPVIGFSDGLKPLTFKTKKEVLKKIEDIEKRVGVEADKYINEVINESTSEEISEAVTNFFCKLFNTTQDKVDSYVSSSLLCAMIDELADSKLGISEYTCVLKPIQILI